MDEAAFRSRLDEVHVWPCLFVFKFIVPRDKAPRVEALLPGAAVSLRPSAKGNYVGITAEALMAGSDEVLAVYREALKIEGIIAL